MIYQVERKTTLQHLQLVHNWWRTFHSRWMVDMANGALEINSSTASLCFMSPCFLPHPSWSYLLLFFSRFQKLHFVKINTRVSPEMSHLRKFSEREHWVEHINRPFVTGASNTDFTNTKINKYTINQIQIHISHFKRRKKRNKYFATIISSLKPYLCDCQRAQEN